MGTEDVAHAYNTHTMEYASAIEKNGRMPFFHSHERKDTRIHWEMITLSEGSQREKVG